MIRRWFDILEEKARRRAILYLCPDIDDVAEQILTVSRDITEASMAVGEQVSHGDFSAYMRQPGRAIMDAESHLNSPIFSIQDLRYGSPYRSRGYNAPGRWGEKNRRRDKK